MVSDKTIHKAFRTDAFSKTKITRFTRLLELMHSLKPKSIIEKFFFFIIYQNYTLALTRCLLDVVIPIELIQGTPGSRRQWVKRKLTSQSECHSLKSSAVDTSYLVDKKLDIIKHIEQEKIAYKYLKGKKEHTQLS